MTDILTPQKRSWNMSRIRSKNTRPEIMVRSLLHRMGYRFSLRHNGLPCRPDIVLPMYKTVIFVHGCFWHRHKGCKYAYTPKSRKKFWQDKFRDNTRRDKRNKAALRKIGWRVVTVWECWTEKPALLAKKLKSLIDFSECCR